MNAAIKYGNTVLAGINKAGILKCDANGYYDMVLGALGVINSAGEVYVDDDSVRSTFAPGSILQRRISGGKLRGEYGHPRPTDFPSMAMFNNRVRGIHEDKVAVHIAEIGIQDIMYEGKKVPGIMGRVCPTGPYGEHLRKSLDNKEENVCFSGRYFSNVFKKNGRVHRQIHTVVTWDYVNEPGIAMAEKYASPSLESLNDTSYYVEQLKTIAQDEARHGEAEMVMESGGLSATEVLKSFGYSLDSQNKASTSWMSW